MKKQNFIYALLLSSAVAGFTSCEKNDEPGGDVDNQNLKGMFILNQGSYQMNNAGLAFYALDKTDSPFISDLFYDVNNYKLGDNATDIVKHNGHIYISLTGSNCIYKLNEKGEVAKQVLFHNDPELQGGVRYMTFKDNSLYASFYGGIVAKLSADDLTVEAKLNTGGSNLEGIAEVNGTLYVADSYQSTYDSTTGQSEIVYGDKLYMIDLKSFTVKGTVTVSLNPNKLIAEDGKLFLISWGNYADKGYSFQMIDPSDNNKVTELAVATDMGAGNGKVYLLNSVTDWSTWTSTNTWFSYDIKGNRVDNSSFMKNAPSELTTDHISMVTVDDASGDIYIGTTIYTPGNGQVYRFEKDGSFKINCDCGGENPIGAVFM